MKRALRLRSTRLAIAVAAALSLGMALSPLLGVWGVESALVLGIVLPPFVAAAAARYVAALRRDGVHARSSRIVARACGLGLVVLAVPLAVLGLNMAFRVPSCNPVEGFAFVLLGPGAGVLLAACTGATVGAFVRRARVATLLAVLFPLAAIALGIFRFWSSPAIFVYQHYVGWFPGALYDEGAFIPTPYLSFRALTLAILVAIAAFLGATWDPGTFRARLYRLATAPARATLATVLVVLVITADAFGAELGHVGDAELIAEELGATHRGERCIVHAPRDLPLAERERLVADCDLRVRMAEADLGVRQERPVTAFFFRSAEEKQRFMGAAHTFVAKPWRDEVYLQLRGWPHPVLHHEVVHVVAGNTAVGPFRVGGHLGGWLPDPALIEGVAVAVAWDVRDGLTPHQWAAAMRRLDLMPSLDGVVGLSFLGQPPRNAYTVAGSFIRYLIDTYGAAPVRRAYRTGDLAEAVGRPLAELEREWHAFLDEVELPDDAMALAEVRFSERSIFSAVCPHEVAKLRTELAADIAVGDAPRALESCHELLDIDPGDAVTRAQCVGVNAWSGRLEQALAELRLLESEPEAPEPIQALAREGLADAAWRRGDAGEAIAMYRALLDEPQTDDIARQIEVKVIGIEAGGPQARLVFDLLVGEVGAAATPPVAVYIARELARERIDGLGPYLEARQLMAAGRYDLALPAIELGRERGLPTERLREEARRMHGTTLLAVGRTGAAARAWREALADPGSSEGQRAEARDWLRRIRMEATALE